MSMKAVLVILAVLVPLKQTSGEVTDGKSGNGHVNIYNNINLPGYNLGGGGASAASQEALLAELQGQVRDMEMKLITIPNLQKQFAELTEKLTEQNARLTDKLTEQNARLTALQEQVRNVTNELWLHKKSCCNKTYVCPSGYVQFLDKCYRSFSDRKNYTDARSDCKAAGESLAMPKDKATNDFLSKHFKNKHVPVFWLGLTDVVTEGTWVWEDGTPLSWSNWMSGYPVTSDPSSDCAAMSINTPNQWLNDRCNYTWNHICEVGATISP